MKLFKEVDDPSHFGPTDSLRYGTVAYVPATDAEVLEAAARIQAKRINAGEARGTELLDLVVAELMKRVEALEKKHP